eukprot:gnl/TRDRNA2_/TRDRNA2_175567_c2_seq20.p1 gnl/TRDRNA2_/TRDRNA2_175567_c2~~gnl/TRDRNA2_/TRDRNA2_175567_c2_seq20.p1  ORF type:complete len:120 (-),score=20.80 gnl/TRDRNA2_/TRDRNA2_175567_c2_seq20:221-580(-)
MDFWQTADVNNNGSISYEEFVNHIATPKGKHMLKMQGIDVYDAEFFYDLLVHATGMTEVDVGAFTDCALRMSGHAKAMDVQALHYEIQTIKREHRRSMEECMAQFKLMNASLNELKHPR